MCFTPYRTPFGGGDMASIRRATLNRPAALPGGNGTAIVLTTRESYQLWGCTFPNHGAAEGQ